MVDDLMPADPDNPAFSPGPADLSLTGQAVALVHDGATGGGISDFKGKSRWRAVPDGFEVYVEERLGNAASREPAVIDVLASRLGADPIRREKGSDAKDHGDRGEDGGLRFPGGSELKVQIVSATVDQTFWQWANQLDSKPRFVSTHQCAVWIAAAVQSKLDILQTDRLTMILALDARHAAYLADESVVRAAADLIQGIETLGFQQIWVVGPIAARCIALYPGK